MEINIHTICNNLSSTNQPEKAKRGTTMPLSLKEICDFVNTNVKNTEFILISLIIVMSILRLMKNKIFLTLFYIFRKCRYSDASGSQPQIYVILVRR